MIRGVALLAAGALPLLSGCSGGDERVVTVLAAASLTDVFTAIEADLEADDPGLEVRISYAASSTIVQQVNEAAPVDVIALAGTGALEPLEPEYRVGPDVVFATNRLELAVQPGNPAGVQGVADLAEDSLTVVVCAAQVPCGAAAQTLFAEQGVTASVDSFEPDVRAALSKVALGEADVAVVYRTDVQAAGERVEGVAIPSDRTVVTRYPILAVSDSQEALAVVEEVLSERGQQHLADAGFGAP